MQINIPSILVNLIVLSAVTGFFISKYIYSKKKRKTKLVCPRRSNCDTVIHSDYSSIWGIPVEVLGMIYYAGIASAYTLLSLLSLWSHTTTLLLFLMSACSVMFSLYLVSLQVFVIKQWCLWCLSSAFVSVLIFVLSYFYILTLYKL